MSGVKRGARMWLKIHGDADERAQAEREEREEQNAKTRPAEPWPSPSFLLPHEPEATDVAMR